MRRLTALVFAAAVALSLAACGKVGAPDNVPGGNYPTSYPTR